KATWPVAPEDVEAANAAFPDRPVEHDKTWREQVHRHAAATLGLLVLAMALIANWRNRALRAMVVTGAALAALGTVAYILGKA
ncbi:heme A synthase, partial [Enterococcus hirae]